MSVDREAILSQALALRVGDHVGYSAAWLRSVGAHGLGSLRGQIVELSPVGSMTLARIEWDGEAPERVNVANLARVGGTGWSA